MMQKQYRFMFSILAVTIAAFFITACGGRSFDYHPIHEIPKGPGILTDDSDGAVVYDSKNKGVLQTVGKEKKADTSHGSGETIADEAKGLDRNESDFKEFNEYQRWKKWKEEAKNKGDYQEFLEWREWKSYQKWKEQHPLKQ